jgi:hypothetical protein
VAEVRKRDQSRLEAEAAFHDERLRKIEKESVPYPIIMQVVVERILNRESYLE